MKYNKSKLIEYTYYFSLIALFILYLFPGSILGYFFYGDLTHQPNIIENPIGTSINHLFFFTYFRPMTPLIDYPQLGPPMTDRLLLAISHSYSLQCFAFSTHFNTQAVHTAYVL